MAQTKQVAVLVRRDQAEALRVAAGLTLAGNGVDVYVLDRPLADTEGVREQMEVMDLADITPISVIEGDRSLPYVADAQTLAERILAYDVVIAL
jgi:hypothetical protein